MGKKDESEALFGAPTKGVHTLDDLEQVRVMSDPLRMRILESLVEKARTTKQVAQLLDEKPTRLYHHVEALERVGLIKLAGTRPNRGTVEKYYVAIARAFRADASLFSGQKENADDEVQTLRTMISTIMQRTGEDLEQLLDAGASLEVEGVLSFLEICASEEEVTAIQSELHALLERLAELAVREDGDGDAGRRRYRLTVAYFPLDRSDGEK